MDTKVLRQKILDLAIRGKLVPQDPNDEPASVLLERIRAEKQQVVKDGKLKAKDIKNDTVIFKGDDNLHYEQLADGTVKCIEDEIPFELPDGWAWERLGNVTTIARGGSPRPIKSYLTTELDGVNWIKIGDTEKNGKYIFSTKEKIKPEGIAKSRYVKSGDFLLTNSMSFGRPYILKTDGCIHDGWLMIGNTEIVFNQDYLYYALSSDFMYNMLSVLAGGSTVDNLNSDLVKSLLFPIPPMQEQIIIANKAESLMKIVDTINNNEKELLKNIKSIKSKILDLAIRGKLVPQDPNDEPASVLLERIREEKEELIKQGKIKHDKKESVIFKGDDNSYYEKIENKLENIDNIIPFEIPDTWQWCRGYSCFAGMESEKPSGEFFDYIDIDAIDNHLHRIKNTKRMLVSNAPSRASRAVKTGSVLFSLVRPYLENIALIDEKYANSIASTGFYVCNSSGALYPEYMFCLMISGYVVNGLNQFMKGDNSPSISKDNIENWLYPIPPLNEQKMICHKMKRLFSEIEAIEKSLS